MKIFFPSFRNFSKRVRAGIVPLRVLKRSRFTVTIPVTWSYKNFLINNTSKAQQTSKCSKRTLYVRKQKIPFEYSSKHSTANSDNVFLPLEPMSMFTFFNTTTRFLSAFSNIQWSRDYVTGSEGGGVASVSPVCPGVQPSPTRNSSHEHNRTEKRVGNSLRRPVVKPRSV